MVSPRKENSWMVDILLKILGVPQPLCHVCDTGHGWARKLAKELRERASEDMRRESAAKVHSPTQHVHCPAKAKTVVAKAPRKLRESNI